MKRACLIAALMLALGLAGCSETPQDKHAIQGSPEYQGTGTAFVVSGWQPGDRASWSAQLKNRTIQGQNEYPRVQ